MKRILLCAALLAASLAAHAQLGGFDIGKALDIGRKMADAAKTQNLSQEEEVNLGDGICAGFLGATKLHPDANMQRYVNRVGKWLALHSDRPDLPWTFGVIDTETINAFAMPGGNVIISSGLLKRLSSESELAGVLSHEIAHVVKKHQLSAIQSSQLTDIASDVGKEYAANRVARGGGSALAQAGKGVLFDKGIDLVKNGFFLRPLDRSMEYEADQLGIVIATRSGYDPYGLVAALQMLAQYKGGGDAASVFSTHPPATDRIAELEKFLPAVDKYASQPQLEGRFHQMVKQ